VAEEILTEHWQRIDELAILPFTDGRFVVRVSGKAIFSKAETGRFPTKGEMARLLSHP
jgi:selT/selW/selH-like putative selenoprotein